MDKAKILRNLLKIFWIFPVKRNRIVFRSTHGTKYNCNPKYICEYLQKNYPGRFEMIWAFEKQSIPDHKYLEQQGIKVINQMSLYGLFLMITAGVLIDNHGVMSYIPVRKGQEVINTWHAGGAYKRGPKDSDSSRDSYMDLMRKATTAFLSSCRSYSLSNLKKVNAANPEKIKATGCPRNDIFFEDRPEIKEKVYDYFGIPKDKKVVLYAPTFRMDANIGIYLLEIEKVCEACNKRFGGDFVFAIRLHPAVEHKYEQIKDDRMINTSVYEDMQELLYAFDVLITDYSSCMWDMSLGYKPCFIYAADLEYYKDKRDFHTPIEEWPFPLSQSQEELYETITRFDADKYRIDVTHHHEALGSYETGTARKSVAEYIIEKTQ